VGGEGMKCEEKKNKKKEGKDELENKNKENDSVTCTL
jgi:hypothetical protein